MRKHEYIWLLNLFVGIITISKHQDGNSYFATKIGKGDLQKHQSAVELQFCTDKTFAKDYYSCKHNSFDMMAAFKSKLHNTVSCLLRPF